MTSDGDPIMLLAAWREGDEAARDQLFNIIYDDLAAIASSLLRREYKQVSLFTGDLLNEAIVRLFNSKEIDVVDKNHLLALAARVMRRVLLDHARSKNRVKRKGINIALTGPNEGGKAFDINLLRLEEALIRLRAIDPARADIVEMRYFGGLTIEEIATVQGISPATVKRSWATARLWLLEAIGNEF